RTLRRRPRADFLSADVICSAFFFQAEDGIRDFHVTGVQTCALPILLFPFLRSAIFVSIRYESDILTPWFLTRMGSWYAVGTNTRSEERRVGKECRSRWSTYK